MRRLLSVFVLSVALSSIIGSAAEATEVWGNQAAVPNVTPKSPGVLAAGPNGTVYVVDPARDEVLERLSDGRFVALAGDGKQGFSGDGGPARGARLDLLYYSGIAVGGHGTVYFTDAGNDRVRGVLPNGTIETIAGGGTVPLGFAPVPAREASLGKPYSGVAGLTIGPNGQLYLATDTGVYRLAPNGDLYWAVGKSEPLPTNWGGVYSNPAIQNDFTAADRLAFDGAGDLYVAGGGGWGLYEMTATGALQFIEVFRGEGAGTFGSLASDPDGSVIECYNSGVFARAPDGKTTTIATATKLSTLLGKENTFTGGYGVAVDSHGDVFVDMDASVWSSTAALMEIHPNGTMTTLWKLRELP
jgi:serine/threonine-protein kinase